MVSVNSYTPRRSKIIVIITEVSEFSPLGMARPNSAASIHQQTPPIVHSTPPTPSPAPTPDMILQQFGGLAGLQQGVLGGLEMPQPKRRRLRRHPVWMFFKDLEDRVSISL